MTNKNRIVIDGDGESQVFEVVGEDGEVEKIFFRENAFRRLYVADADDGMPAFGAGEYTVFDDLKDAQEWLDRNRETSVSLASGCDMIDEEGNPMDFADHEDELFHQADESFRMFPDGED